MGLCNQRDFDCLFFSFVLFFSFSFFFFFEGEGRCFFVCLLCLIVPATDLLDNFRAVTL